jgi:hypothetical protein
MMQRIMNYNLVGYIYTMAEIAVPLLGLGAMYIISNQGDDKDKVEERFTNMGKPDNSLPGVVPAIPPINYPVSKPISQSNVRYYDNPNQATDKYFLESKVEELIDHNSRENTSVKTGLDGRPIDTKSFKHNNMQPFFGARVRGATVDRNTAESTLDNMQGAGSQHITKKEQAPLFKPQKEMSWANGMPNMSEFYLSRQNPSTRMANVKPWDEERVAPGLGQGYTTTGSGNGYNAGVEDRNAWLPKTVNQLRTDNNPRLTYTLDGHQGPATSYIKDYHTVETQGKVNKNRPDTDYTVGPSRWFTTTGIEKAQTARGIEVLHDVNRPETTKEYFGTGASTDTKKASAPQYYHESTKQQLAAPGIAAPSGKAAPTTGDHGHGTYQKYCNNRSTVEQGRAVGGVEGLIKSAMAPILDILRPTRKENVIGNLRPNGNVNGAVPHGQVYNPADRTRTTIREQTEGMLDNNHLNVQAGNQDGYLVAKHNVVGQERDTTNVSYKGGAGPASSAAASSYAAGYNQRNNPNKTQVSRPNHGVSSSSSNYQNISIAKRDADRAPNRGNAPSASVSMIPSVETFGDINMPQTYDQGRNCDRINPDILKAFKENPYTKSLNSWA